MNKIAINQILSIKKGRNCFWEIKILKKLKEAEFSRLHQSLSQTRLMLEQLTSNNKKVIK